MLKCDDVDCGLEASVIVPFYDDKKSYFCVLHWKAEHMDGNVG